MFLLLPKDAFQFPMTSGSCLENANKLEFKWCSEIAVTYAQDFERHTFKGLCSQNITKHKLTQATSHL